MDQPSVGEQTHQQFLDYTSKRMDEPKVEARFSHLKRKIEEIFPKCADPSNVKVLDIGCGIGVQARLWARDRYQVTAIDYDPGLIEIAKKRSESSHDGIEFKVGSADALPLESESFDICLAIELLEHVGDWKKCLDEFCRILKPGGLLLVTTTNVISPRQNEYRLPLYSWWPSFVKRPIPELVRTRYPALANYTPCPALHWFSVFQLKRELASRGLTMRDRLDVMDLSGKPWPIAALVRLARRSSMVKRMFYLFFTGTIAFGFKN